MPENKGCLFFLFDIFKNMSRSKEKISYPYKPKKLLSKAELSFYHCLSQAVPEYSIMCKCRMEDIMYVPRGTENYMKYRGYIKSRHIDFVLCDKQDMHTKLVIELDDKSHNDTIDSDKRKDEILQSAQIPIIRVQAQKAYNIEILRNLLNI